MDLKEYEDGKFALAQFVRAASEALPKNDASAREQIGELFARLAEDRFNVVVIGHFNRGKTSLMNALLGTDRLPTGILPLTSVITTVSYGSQETVYIHFRQGSLSSRIAFEDLPEYLTQDGNPGNVRNVKTANVQLPIELLRRGFHLVDTPGLGSAIHENTSTTEEYLTEADAFFLVTAYDAPLSSDEMSVLNAAARTGTPVFVIINKHDIVSPVERESTSSYIRDRLATIGGLSGVTLLSVSARFALEARRSADHTLFERSGIPELEAALVRFLVDKKSREFLERTSIRLTDMLSSRCADPSLNEILGRLRAFQSGLRSGTEAAVRPTQPSSARHSRSESPPAYLCEICDAVADAVFAHLRQYQYDLGANEGTQISHAQRGGFCPFHAWQYASLASPQGIAKAYPRLLRQVAAILRTPHEHANNQVMKPASGALWCPSCMVASHAEGEALHAIIERLEKQDVAAAGDARFCLPHLRTVLTSLGDVQAATTLSDSEAVLFERLAEDLQRFALKHDALRRGLTSDEERRSADNALLLLSGKRSVTGPSGRSDYF